MEYKVLARPKLSRNKYGEVENKDAVGGGNSYFTSSASQNGGGTAVEYTEFVGSTNTLDGKKGLVPAPKTNNDEPLIDNDNIKFLKGTGAWVDIPISRYTTENHNKDGIDLNGNLTVSDTLTTNTLNVLGAAHFWELIIDKVKAAGGNVLITPASMEVDYVGEDIVYPVDTTKSPYKEMFYNETEGTGIYGLQELFNASNIVSLTAKRVYMKNEDTNHTTLSEFEIGDMVRCKTINLGKITQDSNNDGNPDVYLKDASGRIYGVDTNNDGVADNYDYDNDGTLDTYILGEGWDTNGDGIVDYPIDNSAVYPISPDSEPDSEFTNKDYWTFVMKTGFQKHLEQPCLYIDIFKYFTDSNGRNYGLGTLITEEGNQGNTPYSTADVEDGVMLPEFKFGYGDFQPEIGDNIVSLGHLWNGDRQGAIILSALNPMDTELKPPSIAQYKGIRTFGLLNRYRNTIISANNNEFHGSFFINYNGNYVDINERINLFTTDITTGLEKVGIHLDGENSTIKMVGSVEVRQNSDTETDTLTVWDKDGKMRVKISPEAIPGNAVNNVVVQNFNTLSGSYYPDGSVVEHHTWTEFIWSWNHKWEYYTSNGSLSFAQTLSLGTLAAEEKISVSDLNTTIQTKAYFKGQNYTSKRGTTQNISSIILRLQRYNNGTYVNVNSYNLTNTASVNVQAENVSINNVGSIFSNTEITTGGTYRLRLEIVFNLYATITFDSQQSNPYYLFDTTVSSKAKITKPTESLTLIGKDGIVFHTEDTSEYFYAGNNGITIKWGDNQISLSDSEGLKTNCAITNYTANSSRYLLTSDSYVNATSIDTDTTIYLPNTGNYGVGRVLTILGNDFITLQSYTSYQKILVGKGDNFEYNNYPAKSTTPYNELTTMPLSSTYIVADTTGEGSGDKYYRTHKPIVRLLCTGTGWLLI